MKKTFDVTMRQTVIYTQVVRIQAGNSHNAAEMAPNYVKDKWEYDTESIEVEMVEEVEDAEPEEKQS